MIRRFRRLMRAFLPSLCQPDDAWALERLSPEEAPLYRAMDARDREHALEVAQTLLSRHPDAPDYAVRAALLHDSGKASRPYYPLERILVGLYSPKVPAEPLKGGLYGAWQVRQHHPEYAARHIRDERVAAIVLEHHRPQSLWGKRLHEADQEF
nr:HD domain-containing protein [Calidithermus timidus]